MFARRVEIGRVVYIPTSNTLGVIVNVLDHSRVLIDGPSIDRQTITFKKCLLTDIVIEITMNAGASVVSAQWTKQQVDAKWKKTAWAAKLLKREVRAKITDFDRFKVMVLRKQSRRVIGKQMNLMKKKK